MRFQQGSAKTFLFGPVTEVDGITPETTLTPAATDILIGKDGAGTLVAKADATAPVHVANGFYSITLNAADLDTAGNLLISLTAPTLPPVWKTYEVQPTQTYTDFYATGATGYSTLATGDLDTALTVGSDSIDSWVGKLSAITLGNGVDAGDGTASSFTYSVPGGLTYTANFTYTGDGTNLNRTLTSIVAA